MQIPTRGNCELFSNIHSLSHIFTSMSIYINNYILMQSSINNNLSNFS